VIGARIRSSLGARLLIGQLLVILTGSVTLMVVALRVAPERFHIHVRESLGATSPEVSSHLDQAFGEAVLVALVVATAAALVVAAAVSLFLTVRIVRPVHALAAAARRVSSGEYAARAPVAGEDELAQLGSAFNQMAASLEAAERHRLQLIGDLGHELRTPLATIDGYVEGLADGVVAPDAATWRVLRTETRRLGRLVEDLRAVSRAEERQLDLRIREVEPAALVGAAVEAAARSYGAKGVRLATDVAPALGALAVDSDRLGEVLANLLDNALRHTPPGGTVTVSGRRTAEAIELAVADDGEGIEPAELARVFERFHRGDPARRRTADSGSGIGLTIARAIVEAHGGRIAAESAGPGAGSRFVVTLGLAAR